MQSTIQLTRHLIRAIPFFSQKNFEPLKRLTQCSFIFASKNVLHRIYAFVLWQVRRYGRLTLRPPLLTRLRTNV